jgi:hypothetical protein
MKPITELLLLKKYIKPIYGLNKKLQLREIKHYKAKFIESAREDQDSYFFFYKYYSAMYAVLVRPLSKILNKHTVKSVSFKECEAPLIAKLTKKAVFRVKKKWLLDMKNRYGIKFCEIHIFPKKNNYFCYFFSVSNMFFFNKPKFTLHAMTNSGLKNFVQAKKRKSLAALDKGISYLISKLISLYRIRLKKKKLFLIVRTVNIVNLYYISFIKKIFKRYNITIHFFFVSYKKSYGYFRTRKKRRI